MKMRNKSKRKIYSHKDISGMLKNSKRRSQPFSYLHPQISPSGVNFMEDDDHIAIVSDAKRRYIANGWMPNRRVSEAAETKKDITALMSLEGTLTAGIHNAIQGYDMFDSEKGREHLKELRSIKSEVRANRPQPQAPQGGGDPAAQVLTRVRQMAGRGPAVSVAQYAATTASTTASPTKSILIATPLSVKSTSTGYRTDPTSEEPSATTTPSVIREQRSNINKTTSVDEEKAQRNELKNIRGDIEYADRMKISYEERKKKRVLANWDKVKKKVHERVVERRKKMTFSGGNATSAGEAVAAAQDDVPVQEKVDERPQGIPAKKTRMTTKKKYQRECEKCGINWKKSWNTKKLKEKLDAHKIVTI